MLKNDTFLSYFFPLPSSILHLTSAISHQPSDILHLPSYFRASSISEVNLLRIVSYGAVSLLPFSRSYISAMSIRVISDMV